MSSSSRPFACIGIGAPIMDSLAQVPDSFLSQVGGAKGGMEYLDTPAMEKALLSLQGQLHHVPGGSAANTTQALAQLGQPVTFLGKLGNDSAAEIYRNHFQQAGGDVSRFKQGDLPNARCLSLVTPDSQRTMRTNLGAALTLSPQDITLADFQDCRHAHLEGYLLFNPELTLHILKLARQAHCTISLDLASFEVVQAAREQLTDILGTYIDIVFANEDEAKAFLGPDKTYPDLALELNQLCQVAAVKVGKDGSFIARDAQVTPIPPPKRHPRLGHHWRGRCL
ncbi:MAG: adenosine kinase, partial [Blastochloris sp.]|nr:adenosine kinase [Blastochloris sp.]